MLISRIVPGDTSISMRDAFADRSERAPGFKQKRTGLMFRPKVDFI
jgi:hypothetical protein